MENKEEELPKWMNFICPSCGIAYGISTLIKTIKKRKARRHITMDSTYDMDIKK
jgi:hypothetical protein